MFKKLKSLYPNSIITNQKPEDYFSRYHWFFNEINEWIGIPNEALKEDQLTILKTLFHYVKNENFQTSPESKSWYLFLFDNGPLPKIEKYDSYRLIYFQWSSGKVNHHDFEAAIRAFFESNITLIWESKTKGVIIEPKTNHSLSEFDIHAMIETIQADFYIEPIMYVGKFRKISSDVKSIIHCEKELLEFGYRHFKQDKVFLFEKLTPKHLAHHLPDLIKTMIDYDILPVLEDDLELFSTIKSFLQNNMNASITAKKLYIHRNTLQYRLDKFTEKTGIPLKDFYSAMTVYIACILFEEKM